MTRYVFFGARRVIVKKIYTPFAINKYFLCLVELWPAPLKKVHLDISVGFWDGPEFYRQVNRYKNDYIILHFYQIHKNIYETIIVKPLQKIIKNYERSIVFHKNFIGILKNNKPK